MAGVSRPKEAYFEMLMDSQVVVKEYIWRCIQAERKLSVDTYAVGGEMQCFSKVRCS